MTTPNWNTLWTRTFADELVRTGIDAVCIASGSRSTPLTETFDRYNDIEASSHSGERSAAYFTLGRARRTSEVTPIIYTPGTAAASSHLAVIEASQVRVPTLVLAADRPPESHDNRADQTVGQEKLCGGAVRWHKDMPEPKATDRKLRGLRTTTARAISETMDVDAGPVHLNFPFRKLLESAYIEGDAPVNLDSEALDGRSGSRLYVKAAAGVPELFDDHLRELVNDLVVDQGLVIAGSADLPGFNAEVVAAFAHTTGLPVTVDPPSELRFGGRTRTVTVLDGYDTYFDERVIADWADPEVVVHIGASPTSKALRKYLAYIDARQYLANPTGRWHGAGFDTTDFVRAESSVLARRLSQLIRNRPDESWNVLRADTRDAYWDLIDDETGTFEGRVAADVADLAPELSTLSVPNSILVRSLDRFIRPSTRSRMVFGNRDASGIDGAVSSALGADSVMTDHLILLAGDLAYHYDMNGLLALGRFGVDVITVPVNDDGDGIFRMFPIEEYEPPFTDQSKTPRSLDFTTTEDLYSLSFTSVDPDDFRDAYAEPVAINSTGVVGVRADTGSSHRVCECITGRTIE